MSTFAGSIGFLVDEGLSPEQRSALDWCEATDIEAETVTLADIAAGTESLDAYDVCWWHRTEPVAEVTDLPDCQGPIEAYLRAGNGLLLSLRAMEAVTALGIDPVSPDVSTVEAPTTTTGLLCKAVYADHPAFAEFDGLRLQTRLPEGDQPSTRYESILPERGEVLASTCRENTDVPNEIALVGWQVGNGDVAGLGTGLHFEGPASEETETTRTRLLEGLFDVLGGDDRIADARPKDVDALSRRRAWLAEDHQRPQYHLSPPANWLNDPNGLIQWNGTYHVFYQYNPAGPHHGTIHWGHAVSDDLVTWEDRPVALTPSPAGPDRDGCWSGCAVDVDGTPTILYTGGRGDLQLPCLGTAIDDELSGWEKSSENPVIDTLPEEPPLRSTDHWRAEFRDHNVWQAADGTWHHLIGSGVEDGGGTALLYTNEDGDMTDWEYQGPILVGEPELDGHMWECPELLDLGDRQLLHVSNYEEVRYYLGSYDADDGWFDTDRAGLLDHGSFYAPQSLRDDEGRWLTWGWVKPGRDVSAQWDAGWSGTLSLPRQIDLDAAGRLRQRPAAELTALRDRHCYDGPTTLDDEHRSLPVSGHALEFSATVRIDDADEFGLIVRQSPDGDEETLIRYTRENELVVDRAGSSLDPRASDAPVSMPVSPADEPLSLRLFLDGSVLECFVNDRHCLTTRIYPTREDSDGVSMYAAGGSAVVEEFDIWQLGSAWPEAE